MQATKCPLRSRMPVAADGLGGVWLEVLKFNSTVVFSFYLIISI